MGNTTDYVPTERKAIIGAREITVRNLIPVFKSREEREMAGQKVQDGLYRVFHKYMTENAS